MIHPSGRTSASADSFNHFIRFQVGLFPLLCPTDRSAIISPTLCCAWSESGPASIPYPMAPFCIHYSCPHQLRNVPRFASPSPARRSAARRSLPSPPPLRTSYRCHQLPLSNPQKRWKEGGVPGQQTTAASHILKKILMYVHFDFI